MDELVSFAGDAETVVDWIASRDEASLWSGLTSWPVPPELLVTWHAEHDVVPFLLMVDGVPAGYGELWEDEAEVELVRLVVDHRRRGQRLGRSLVGRLVAEAQHRGFNEIWLRVLPENESAIRCYLASGFVRTTPEEEAELNRPQPREYVWMRYTPPALSASRGGPDADAL